jgi:hypothetical protein
MELDSFPGGDLVIKGLADLKQQILSEEALLLLVARPRLVALGFDIPVPETTVLPYEHALYAAIAERDAGGAHSAYNALIRRIVSFTDSYARLA